MPSVAQRLHDRTKLKDLDHALVELGRVRRELGEILADETLDRHQRDRALVDPVSRLTLVRRYVDELIADYGRPTRPLKKVKSKLTIELGRRWRPKPYRSNHHTCAIDLSPVIE